MGLWGSLRSFRLFLEVSGAYWVNPVEIKVMIKHNNTRTQPKAAKAEQDNPEGKAGNSRKVGKSSGKEQKRAHQKAKQVNLQAKLLARTGKQELATDRLRTLTK